MIGRVLATQATYGPPATQRLNEALRGQPKAATSGSRVTAGAGTSVVADLARISGISEQRLRTNTDIFSVTGSDVTSLFTGGQDTFTLVWGPEGTNITFAASGTQPNATKSVAVIYGNDATPAQREFAQSLALRYLNMHVDDHQSAPNHWDKPLFDFSA